MTRKKTCSSKELGRLLDSFVGQIRTEDNRIFAVLLLGGGGGFLCVKFGLAVKREMLQNAKAHSSRRIIKLG